MDRPLELTGKKGSAIIAYLSRCPGMTATREKLADLLWSDSDSEHSRNSLRQALSVLRQDLSPTGANILHSNKDTIGLNAGSIDSDAAVLEAAQSARSGSQLEEAISVYTGPFLDGFFSGSSVFEEWAAGEREKFLNLAIGSLEKLARLVDMEKGLAIARRLVAMEPTREASYRLEMELLALAGQRDRAIRTFEACRAMLQKEFGVDVSPETRTLWQSLLVGPDPEIFTPLPRQMTSSAEAGSRKKPSVGVLSFVNLTGKRGEDYFARGLVQDITTALAQRRDYIIVAELPTLTTETGSLDVRRIAATYNVQYLLNGSVQRVADDLRVNVQLIDTGNGHNVWAQRFDGRAQEGLEFQDRIAQLVMVALGIELQTSSWKVRDKSPPGGPEVRRLVNQALTKYYEMTKSSLQAAMGLAEQALAIDPDNPRAMRTLSITISVGLAVFGALPNRQEHVDRALSLAKAAVKAVPDDEIARCFLAFALSTAGRIEEAIAELCQSISLNPNYANAHGDLAALYALKGQTEQALHEANEAIRLGPLDSTEFWRYHSIAVAKFASGDDLEALEIARQVVRTRPDFVRGALYWAAAAMATGNGEEASRAIHYCLSQIPELNLGNISPVYVPRYVNDAHQRRFIAMLARAGLPDS
ncbi:FlgO family outer membrane protein [Taklimakanibacter deserti]|uniref:FlgO family outer membrane protein n=1 Tax=Taklimakanibacter deserti TaxID=2267839 RepID=UPI0034D3F9BB